MTIRRKVLADQAEARLETLAGVTVYRGEVPGQPPVLQTAGADDPSGRVAAYAVLYPGGGAPTSEAEDLAETHEDLLWSFQITCAAGYSTDCEHLVDRVWDAFYRWSPTSTGLAFGTCKPPSGFDPGPVRRDNTVTPPRFWLPLQFQLPVTT